MRSGAGCLALLTVIACGGDRVPEPSEISLLVVEGLPAESDAMAPYLVADGADLLASWLEPTTTGGHRFAVSRLHDERWSAPVVIAEGDDFFANWADVPKIGVAGDGTLWAHWLAKLGDATYAYGIFIARSDDGGASWSPQGLLHDDTTPAEHGFVAYAAEGDDLRAVWLDGREMPAGSPMSLRTALLADGVGSSVVLDDRVCECCPTELTGASGGVLTFYRDRGDDETRNIGLAQRSPGGWSAPRHLHDDAWRIPGCPVNGPAADSMSERVAVAWFTAGQEQPRVQLAVSDDGGRSFGEPVIVDAERPLGRVDLVLDAVGDSWVSWLAVSDNLAQVRLARFAGEERLDFVVAQTGSSRSSGIPRLARAGERLYLAWVETVDDRPAGIQIARLAAR